MQTITFLGKIYKLESSGSPGKDGFRVTFRLGVRKKYVSEEDKKEGKTQVFVPMIAFGKTAEFIDQYFEDGSAIAVSNCEYNTFESDKDGEKKFFHNFKIGNVDFVPQTSDSDSNSRSNNSKSSKSDSKPQTKSRRELIEDDDDEEEYVPRSKRSSASSASSSSRKRSEEDERVPF